MKASKIALLLLILSFGATVETAWQVRHHLGFGPWGWWALGGRFHGPSFTFEAADTQPVEAGTPVEVENAFGAVTVAAGAPGEVRVTLRKVVYLGTEDKARDYAQRIELRARHEGGLLRVTTNRRDLERSPRGDPEVGFQTHLDLVVPPDTPVKVGNDHGAVRVSDVAGAEVSGSFDEVSVERVGGGAKVEGRHGRVRASAIKGDLVLGNRHGDTLIEDVEGRVAAETEHGQVEVRRVGSLLLTGGHGDVRVSVVRGDLEVRTRHGEVRASEVAGRALVETSFEGVSLEGVGGEARVKTEHGDVVLAGVEGAVDAESSFDDVSLSAIGGPATVRVRHGSVSGRDLAKGARVTASGDEVVLERFQGPVEVESERASVRLLPAGPLTEPVKVTANRGEVELALPAGSNLDLTVSAERGEIAAEVPGLEAQSREGGRLAGRMGSGGNPVVITTTHADVRLRGGAEAARKDP